MLLNIDQYIESRKLNEDKFLIIKNTNQVSAMFELDNKFDLNKLRRNKNYILLQKELQRKGYSLSISEN
jgi:hypothetical protein